VQGEPKCWLRRISTIAGRGMDSMARCSVSSFASGGWIPPCMNVNNDPFMATRNDGRVPDLTIEKQVENMPKNVKSNRDCQDIFL
jgi:hypothetical protein